MTEQTLNDVCELIVDCEHKTAPTRDTGYPSIRTPNIGRGRLLLEGVNRVSEETYIEWSKRAVPQAKDIILAREAPVGNAANIPEGLKVCLGQRTVLIRSNADKIEPQYLVYLLLGDDVQRKFQAYAAGATVAHLNMRDIRGVPLPNLPPLETQRKIAAILSAYDDLIENNKKRIKLLEQAAHDLYREWFVHFRFPGHEDVELVDSGTDVGMVPLGGEVIRLEDAVELAYGKALKKNVRIPGRYPVYGSAGIIDTHNDYLVKAPGIVVGRKGNVGSVFWADDNFYPIDTVYYVKTGLSLHYVFYNLQNQNFINSDAAVPGLSRRQAYSLPFVVPPESTVKRFEDIVSPVFQQVCGLRKRNTALMEARDLLLPRLVSGELDVSKMEI